MAKSSKASSKKGSSKRELIAPNDDKRYIKRDAKGRSLSQDRKKQAKTKVSLDTLIKVINQRRHRPRINRKLHTYN
jgi:hypothetical protein